MACLQQKYSQKPARVRTQSSGILQVRFVTFRRVADANAGIQSTLGEC